MNKIPYYIVVFIITVVFIACSKEDPCETEQISITSMEDEYGCVNTKYQMEIDLSNQYTIIKTQAEFDNLVSGSCDPVAFDFDNYDLIIGKHGLTSGNTSIEYEMTKECDPVIYSLKVTFNQNATTEAPNLTYHVLSQKLDVGVDVEVTIEEKF